jgi:EpsI family protein
MNTMTRMPFIIAAILLIAIIVYTNFLSTVHAVSPLKPLSTFPEAIGDFSQVGTDQTFSDAIMVNLGVDHYIMREYRSKDGYPLWLYIGYYESQTEGEIIHSPKHCMPGSGWNTVLSREAALSAPDTAYSPVKINTMLLQKGMEKQLAHYWYHSRGRVVANEYWDRGFMILDSLLKRRSDGALIRITGSGSDQENDAQKQMQFAADVLREIDQYLPN